MAPIIKKCKHLELENLSKRCEKKWWSLSEENRKKHNKLMKIQLLSPFLFSRVYQDEMWVEWAKSSDLLSQKRIGALDDLTDEEQLNTDLIETAINSLQDEIRKHKQFNANIRDIPFLEGILESISSCNGSDDIQDALGKVERKSWYKIVRSQLEVLYSSAIKLKKDAAVFLAACQVSTFLKSIYNDEKVLKKYEEDSTLDYLEKKKREGNNHYSNSEYSKAITEYTAILYSKPYLYIVFGNRAACYLKKEEFRFALSDGRRAITLNPQWEKGQYRYAQALTELNRTSAAIKVLDKAINVCENKDDLISFRETILSKVNERDDTKKKTIPRVSSDDNEDDCSNSDTDDDDVSSDDMPGLKSETDEDESDSDFCDGPPPLVSDSASDTDTEDDDDEIHLQNKKKKNLIKQPTQSRTDASNIQHGKTNGKNLRKENKAGSKLKGKENMKPGEKAERKERRKKKRREKAENAEVEQLDPIESKKRDLILAMKEGSMALLKKHNRTAVHEYGKAIKIIKSEKIEFITSTEKLVLQYAYGISYYEAGTHVDLVKSMKIFVEINATYGDDEFPLTYYAIGRVYVKQNRYGEAVSFLKKALNLDKSIKEITWPGIEAVIEESKPEAFKVALEYLLSICLNPPKADANCRYLSCKQSRKVIYFSDPDFKGFVRLVCTESCFVDFHTACWKKYRTDIQHRTSDKDYLNDNCLTPDCIGFVKTIKIYDDAHGDPKAEFKAEQKKDTKTPYVDKTKRLTASSKIGLEKKHRKYDAQQKKKEEKGHDDLNHNERIDEVDKMITNADENGLEKNKEVISKDDTKPINDIPLDGEMYILKNKYKEEDDVLFQAGKSKKTKTKKAPKQKVTLDIPYIDKDHKRKIGSKDFETPVKSLSDDIDEFEHEWKKNNEDSFKPYRVDYSNTVVNDFNFEQFKNAVTDPKGTALHVFSMFEQILEAHGCADVHNSKVMLDFYNILDEDSKLLINAVGGPRTFLSKCKRFSFDKKNRNVVYLTNQEQFYKHVLDTKNNKNHSSPNFEDALFTERLDFQRPRSNSKDLMNPQAMPFFPVHPGYSTSSNGIIVNGGGVTVDTHSEDLFNPLISKEVDKEINTTEENSSDDVMSDVELKSPNTAIVKSNDIHNVNKNIKEKAFSPVEAAVGLETKKLKTLDIGIITLNSNSDCTKPSIQKVDINKKNSKPSTDDELEELYKSRPDIKRRNDNIMDQLKKNLELSANLGSGEMMILAQDDLSCFSPEVNKEISNVLSELCVNYDNPFDSEKDKKICEDDEDLRHSLCCYHKNELKKDKNGLSQRIEEAKERKKKFEEARERKNRIDEARERKNRMEDAREKKNRMEEARERKNRMEEAREKKKRMEEAREKKK